MPKKEVPRRGTNDRDLGQSDISLIISVLGTRREMKNVRFISCLLKFVTFCKTLEEERLQTDIYNSLVVRAGIQCLKVCKWGLYLYSKNGKFGLKNAGTGWCLFEKYSCSNR